MGTKRLAEEGLVLASFSAAHCDQAEATAYFPNLQQHILTMFK